MKSFKEFLKEARREPELNPKVSAFEHLELLSNDENVYIHFTNEEKIGITPMSGYKTPLGIYCYPLKEIWDTYNVEDYKSLKQLPFATERDYIQVFKWNGKGVLKDVSDYTKEDLEEDTDKLFNMFSGLDYSYKEAKNKLDDYPHLIEKELTAIKTEDKSEQKIIKELLMNVSAAANELYADNREDEECYIDIPYKFIPDNIKSMIAEYNDIVRTHITFLDAMESAIQRIPASMFFNLCRWFSNNGINPNISIKEYDVNMTKHISKSDRNYNATKFKKIKYRFTTNDLTKNWNKLLRKMGYAGFTDKKGLEVIHSAEPIQAFFLSKEFITPIKLILNKDYKTSRVFINKIKTEKDTRKIESIPIIEIIGYIKSKKIYYGDNNVKTIFDKSYTIETLANYISSVNYQDLEYLLEKQKSSNKNSLSILVAFVLLKNNLSETDLNKFIELAKTKYKIQKINIEHVLDTELNTLNQTKLNSIISKLDKYFEN